MVLIVPGPWRRTQLSMLFTAAWVALVSVKWLSTLVL